MVGFGHEVATSGLRVFDLVNLYEGCGGHGRHDSHVWNVVKPLFTGFPASFLNNLGWIARRTHLAFASMRSWIVASFALALGGGVSAALIVFTSPDRDRVEVYAVAREVASGSELTHDSLRLQSVLMPEGLDTLFTRSDGSQLQGRHASHELTAGQLLQRTDLLAPGGVADERLVFLPIKDAPPAGPGSKLDLLLIAGTADHPAVVPFALGVEVRVVVTGGFVVAVPSRQASAFVYAAEAMRLVAVVAAPNAPKGDEAPIGAPDQAMALAAQP